MLVSGVDAEAIDRFKAKLREKDLKGKPVREATVGSYLRSIRAVLRWGHRRGFVRAVPTIEMPRDTRVAGRRPITPDEFAKVLAAVPSVVGDERAPSWVYLLRGLWASGLRIGEAASLTWDDPALPRVDIDRARPMLIIPAAHQKGARDTITPIVPELLAVLRETPAEARTGFVFNPRQAKRKSRPQVDARISTIVKIGRGIRGADPRDREGYVSAHDLRPSFCYRWAQRVLPQVLKNLARHRDAKTTLTYYAAADAAMTFDAVYEAVVVNPAIKLANTSLPASASPAA